MTPEQAAEVVRLLGVVSVQLDAVGQVLAQVLAMSSALLVLVGVLLTVQLAGWRASR
jgi:hypothetical protein